MDAGAQRDTTRRRFAICLDGTWNNAHTAAKRDDGSKVLKPTNVLKLARAIVPVDAKGTQQITMYDTGVGSMGRFPGTSNRLLELSDRAFGGATGAGFEASLEGPITFLANNFREGDEVFVFGFSRGAAQARALTQFIEWMGGIPTKDDAYFVPMFFRDYIYSEGKADPNDVKTEGTGRRPGPLQPITIRMLGVWDTVLAHGGSFLLRSKPAACVANARHAIAADEQRYTFKPEIWQEAHPGQSLEQRWFPGVHSNIGGGYPKDGLANVSLAWFLDEARELGLETDPRFTSFYAPWAQAKLYQSKSWKFKVMDGVRFKSGVRPLLGHPDTANLTVDPSVLERINSDPKKTQVNEKTGETELAYPQLEGKPYRPDNVREYLRARGRTDELPPDWR